MFSLPLRAMTLRTRFAPSPTGLIHLGNARTALFNALLAKHSGGALVLRIEDTDEERGYQKYVDALLQDLNWLGIDWDEGPGKAGDFGPYCQSERFDIYADYYARLEEANAAYPCFCSPQELKLSRKAQLAAGRPPRYAGTCANLSSSEIEARLAEGIEPTLRYRVPPGKKVEFDDMVRGRQVFLTDDIGDFIIRRANGTPAFFFSNAVDDALMKITHALRGEDHLANTPRQILLLRELELAVPTYGHFALVLGEGGGPLSKREGSLSLQELRENGYLPLGLTNYLARLGHHYTDESFKDEAAIGRDFDAAHIGRAAAHFDMTQLEHWQKEAVARLSETAFWNWVAPFVGELVPENERAAFVDVVRPNTVYPRD
ncbi:MAG: glutamate--tRNA ligase, partial [Gammaproteobacteria bacterium]|nr:glutamate--tRNA ligase [Gammaproteobacteria bacterium]